VLVYGPPAVLLVYGLAAADGRRPRRVPGWLLRLGDASFSIYLLHHLAVDAAKHVGTAIPHTAAPHLLWLAGTVAAAVGTGVVLHRWVERPLLALGKRPLPDLRFRRAIRLPSLVPYRRGRA
jgi:peptidoglycan/LPS O-acetylase OafA/YrhL